MSAALGMSKVLVIGYGNRGRGDDGLGPALAEWVRARSMPDVEVRVEYQLAVEHAADVATADAVYFVDATVDPACSPFALVPLHPEPGLDFTTHALGPGRVLALADELFHARPPAWLLTIAGERFDPFVEELTPAARANLEQAAEHLIGVLANPR